jgi:hypothetical protein
MILPSPDRLRDPDLVYARAQWFNRLRGLFAGQRQETAFVLHGIQCYTEEAGPDWVRWLDDSLDELAEQADRALDDRVFRPLSVNYNPRGVHFCDHLFGADVFLLDGKSWQVHPLDAPVGSLEPPDLDRHPAWQRMKECARAFLERDVSSVIFGLPTIASALNVAVNLYGDRILLAMLGEPDAARHDLRVIDGVLCALHRWYLDALPAEQMQCILPNGRCQPPGYGQLCGCTTQLISGELYRAFVAPRDDELLSLYPGGGMIHLCGAHTQQIAAWNEMACLKALQLNDRAAEDLGTYYRELREDVVFYVNPCEGMPVERILEITGGQRVVIAADLQEPLPCA